MSIVSSARVVGAAQGDGRRHVVESHTDSTGVVHKVEYLSNANDATLDQFMSARAVLIADQLAEAEAAALIAV